MRLSNASSVGQSAFDYYINGTLRGKVRTDYNGHMNFVANGGGHYFFTGGDSGTGTIQMVIASGGNVGIGTYSPSEKLSVNGKIAAKEIKVTATGWPDYVFTPSHRLPDLKEVEKYIRTNGHLPEIPAAAEVEHDGISLGDMNTKLLKKVEEITLYLIELKKENEEMKKSTAELRAVKP